VLGDRLLGNRGDKFAQLLSIPIRQLRLGEEGGIQETDPRTQHSDRQTLLLEAVKELSQRDVHDLKSIPQLVEGHLPVLALVHHFLTGNGLAEAKERQCQVDKAILVLLNIVLAIQHLVEFETHQPGDKSGRRSNSRDDLARNELGLVSIGKLDLVIFRPQIARSRDEIDVVIGIVVFLKLNRLKLETSKRLGRWELVRNFLEF
jgi:hypothetical protein